MKIKSVETTNIRIPLNDPKTFSTKKIFYRDYTVFVITTESGLQGWSFSWGLPAVKTFIDQYKELLIGENAYAVEKIWDKVFRQVDRWDRSGIVMRALAGIDMALWDIIGKAANLPIYKIMGGAREEIEAYHSGGYYPQSCEGSTKAIIDYVVNEMGTAKEKGFHSFKMKIGAASPAVDLERVKQVRRAIGPDCKLMVDANCGYEPEVIIPLAKKMEEYDLTWIEEPVPLDDLRKCERVAKSTSIPIAMGENHFGRWQFRDIIERDCASVIQADPTVCGGFTEYRKLSGMCSAYGLRMAPHCFHDISVQMGLAMPNVTILEYMDVAGDSINVQRIIENPVVAVNGMVRAPEGPGHGLIMDKAAVERYRLS